jgi:hypothetical protein
MIESVLLMPLFILVVYYCGGFRSTLIYFDIHLHPIWTLTLIRLSLLRSSDNTEDTLCQYFMYQRAPLCAHRLLCIATLTSNYKSVIIHVLHVDNFKGLRVHKSLSRGHLLNTSSLAPVLNPATSDVRLSLLSQHNLFL